MQPFFYAPFHTPFGACSIVWQENTQGPRVRCVFLPLEMIRMKKLVQAAYPDVQHMALKVNVFALC